MQLLSKIATLLRLLFAGDFRKIQARWHYNSRLRAIARADKPFVFLCGEDRLVCDPQLPDSASAYHEPPGDRCERGVFRAWLQPGDVAIDAGANVGLFTSVAAARVVPHGSVIAIEPTPRLAEHLRMSAELLAYPVVDVLPAALGGRPGKAKFAFASEKETLVSQSLVGATVPTGTANIREVEVVTLATLTGRLKAGVLPALVKLDVEGVEVEALKAAPPGWLTADGPLWVVECHPQALARFGNTVADVIGMFPATEFSRFMVGKYAGSDGADLPPVPLDESALPPASFHNLIAVPLGTKWTARQQALRPILPGPV